jgi:transmembrane sensor
METSPEAIEKLIQKYIDGNCNDQESAIVEAWYNELADQPHDIQQAEVDSAEETLLVNLKNYVGNKTHIKLWPRIAAVASILICLSAGFYFYKQLGTNQLTTSSTVDIAPGGNKAFLTLADGKRIALTDIKNGELAEQSGVKIIKATDGQLIYTISSVSNETNKAKDYNTIETPNGGQYQVTLPDGSKVWLNAASSLKFPPSFSRLVNRRVELLRGEAYFEIAKDKNHPFIVKSNGQEVKVLGTHFNINSYSDEQSTKTTLLEGSVKIEIVSGSRPKKGVVIRPGQQSILSGERIRIVDADIESDLAWKNQEFVFKGENIQSIMRKLSRWYDIEVNYNGDCSHLSFYGVLSRSKNISSVLKLMENAGVRSARGCILCRTDQCSRFDYGHRSAGNLPGSADQPGAGNVKSF